MLLLGMSGWVGKRFIVSTSLKFKPNVRRGGKEQQEETQPSCKPWESRLPQETLSRGRRPLLESYSDPVLLPKANDLLLSYSVLSSFPLLTLNAHPFSPLRHSWKAENKGADSSSSPAHRL